MPLAGYGPSRAPPARGQADDAGEDPCPHPSTIGDRPAGQHRQEDHEDRGAALAVIWDCRKGEHGRCAVNILEVTGHVDHRDVFLDHGQEGASSTRRPGSYARSVYKALTASRLHRPPLNLFHSALIVQLGDHPYAIEMAPVWAVGDPDRGVVSEGPVGVPSWGRSRLFRYEIRCWRDGSIPNWTASSSTW